MRHLVFGARHSDCAHEPSVRNGAIIGASIGLVSGAYASTYLHFGCTRDPCHETAAENNALIEAGFAGAIIFGAIGALLGKLSQNLT